MKELDELQEVIGKINSLKDSPDSIKKLSDTFEEVKNLYPEKPITPEEQKQYEKSSFTDKKGIINTWISKVQNILAPPITFNTIDGTLNTKNSKFYFLPEQENVFKSLLNEIYLQAEADLKPEDKRLTEEEKEKKYLSAKRCLIDMCENPANHSKAAFQFMQKKNPAPLLSKKAYQEKLEADQKKEEEEAKNKESLKNKQAEAQAGSDDLLRVVAVGLLKENLELKAAAAQRPEEALQTADGQKEQLEADKKIIEEELQAAAGDGKGVSLSERKRKSEEIALKEKQIAEIELLKKRILNPTKENQEAILTQFQSLQKKNSAFEAEKARQEELKALAKTIYESTPLKNAPALLKAVSEHGSIKTLDDFKSVVNEMKDHCNAGIRGSIDKQVSQYMSKYRTNSSSPAKPK